MEVRARSGSGEPCRREPRRPGPAILTKLHGSNFSFHELPFSLYKHPSISARGGAGACLRLAICVLWVEP